MKLEILWTLVSITTTLEALVTRNRPYVHGPNNAAIHDPLSPSVRGADCSCGITNTKKRIIDGTEVDPEVKYPWQVGLRTYYPNGDMTDISCGGSVINTNYVLTAAHCFDGPFPHIHVHVGEHDAREFITDNVGYNKLIPVKTTYIHPNYNNQSFDNDFAILELEYPIVFDDVIKPVCLPEDDSRTYAGETATVAGWGVTDFNNEIGSFKLLEVDVTILEDSNCGYYDELELEVTTNMMCAGDLENGGHNTCTGDSGGPVVVKNENHKYVQVGVVSWATECALEGLPSVFARVTKVLDWIKETTSSGQYCAN